MATDNIDINLLHFTKMHGLGNDYVYVNCLKSTPAQPEKLAMAISDRHFGVGSDGLVLILPSTEADFRMRMFNADGSEAQMCGNAVRCIARYLYDNGLSKEHTLTLETQAGIITLALSVEDQGSVFVRVDMGEPILAPQLIPLNTAEASSNEVTFEVAGEKLTAFCVSMGNPHAVIFVDKITDHHVLTLGPLIEKHSLFPERVNVEFVTVHSASEVSMRVWERGSGETLACGTGAAAVCVAAASKGHTDRTITVQLLGGTLQLFWDTESGHVFKTGPATTVFNGILDIKTLMREYDDYKKS